MQSYHLHLVHDNQKISLTVLELTLNSYTPLCIVYAQNAHCAYLKKLEVISKNGF